MCTATYDINALTKAAKKAKKTWKADKDNKDLKKAWKKAKKALAEAEEKKVAAEAAAKKAAEEAAKKEAEKMDESDDDSSSDDEDSESEEEEQKGPSLEDLKKAMKAAKTAFKADKKNKELKKAFKAAKAAVAAAEGAPAASSVSKKRKRDAEPTEETAEKKAKAEPVAEEESTLVVKDNSKASSNPLANEKVFCGNLSFDIDDDGIKSFFKECGEIVDIFWLKDRETGNFKGCGFVTFSDVDSACKAVEMNGQECMGREIRLDFAKPRPGGDKPRGAKGGKREPKPLSEKPEGCMTVFCGNLSFDIDDAKMQEFATEAGCGEIAHIRWLTDRDSGDFKGCGFIEFGSTEDVDKFVTKNGSDLMGRSIRCDYAKPRAPRKEY